MKIVHKTFSELSIDELYQILKLRTDVFVVEQNCPYPELDNKDQKAIHAVGYVDEKIAAYARYFKQGDYFDGYASIGRILSVDEFRGMGLGRKIVAGCISQIHNVYGHDTGIKIAAQSYLKSFYEELDFIQSSEEFLEDDIPHIYMILKK